ncbi:MAG: permease [Hyphomicrobium sp. 32-62-53]|nr:MAG: permease [Hyphomicrobium sp. 12-62-95]OYX97950.1 MAG: permease [Hyphomicrobium sp. 32-62-53]
MSDDQDPVWISRRKMRWFERGDIDGFFGLALDNLVQMILIVTLCQGVLGFSPALVYGTILPGVAVSLIVGNIFYAWQAKRLARQTGRTDVCALPYGINTVSLFAHVFLIMLPALLAARQRGLDEQAAMIFAWQIGLLACLGSGLIELGGSLVAERIRRASPRAALLPTLAGIALGFISFTFLFRTFAAPVVGLATLGIVLMTYFGRVEFRGRIPGGLVAIAIGTALGWTTGLVDLSNAPASETLGLNLPGPVLGNLLASLTLDQVLLYVSIILPMGLFNVLGSLQNIESAEAAGDRYPTGPSLAVNGIGTLAAALFGSCFPTTIYIGHPGWKAMGARAGYSILNGVFCTLICITGTLAWITWAIPLEAGMAIVLWIGIVMTAQAFEATPRQHAPAVVLGLLPGLGAWGALMVKDGLRVGGAPFSPDVVEKFRASGTYVDGVFALEQGFIFTAMILSAVTVHLIDRKFVTAGLWCLLAAVLSLMGLMHSYRFTGADTVGAFGQAATAWALGYVTMAAIFLSARWLVLPAAEDHTVKAMQKKP